MILFGRHSRIAVHLLTLALIAMGSAGRAEDAAKSVGDQMLDVVTPRGRGAFTLVADRPIGQPAPDVKHVLITVHGALRDVKSYFNASRLAVRRAGAAGEATMVIAPDFPLKEDVDAFHLAPDVLYWTEGGWKHGSNAVGPAKISSYTALDALLLQLSNRKLFPALTDIVMTGHSAGGQVVQRYAATNQVEDRLRQVGISIRYIVANPSSYVYFDLSRPVFANGPNGAQLTGFARADASCGDVNRWHHGFDNAPSYLANRRPAEVEQAYAARNVTYLLGLRDTDMTDAMLDKSCAGNAQGPYRLARGLAYFQYMQMRHRRGLGHRVVLVPDIGHDERGLYTSACGMAALFNQPVPAECSGAAR